MSNSFLALTDPCVRLDWPGIFGNDHPIEIDLGAGDGSFIAAYARRHPERNFLATERLLGRARKIAKKAERGPLPNLKVLRLESAYTLEHLVPPGSVAAVHLMFPDPWPKRRHWDRRLLQPAFAAHLVRALNAGGEFRFTTDHAEYFEKGSEVLNQTPGLEAAPVWDLADYPKTDFEQDFAKEGRATHRGRWVKKEGASPSAS
jgi:tRNA (guanine-N7-)-methyltransferase